MDYITIIQGDDTNFLGDQFLVINFNTDIDLSGFTATFTLGDVTLTYGDLSGKNFEVILSDEITSNLKLGKQYGELKLIDTQQRIRTVTSVIPFLVRKGVNEEIRFVNNSLEVSMNINDTVLNVLIETPGIARAEATRMMSYCNDAKVSAQSYANEAHNTHIQLNQDIDVFYDNISNLNNIIDNAYNTCENNISTINETRDNTINEVETLGNEKIAIATQQANIATQKTQEVSNTYNTAMSDIAASRSASLSAIENKKVDSISDIEDKRVDSISDIEDTAELGRYSLTEIANELLYKWNLFDVVKKDHLLSFSETQGLALPGTYVYKTPVAGERYGYPTFYGKCVEEYNQSYPYVIKNNIDTVGLLNISDGVISGFATGTYFKMNKPFSPNGQNWQVIRKIKTGALGYTQSIFHCEGTSPNIALKIYADGTLRLWLSSNGSAWNIAGEVASTLALSANTDYLVSLAFENTRYVVKFIEYIDENTSLDNAAEYIVVNSSVPVVNGIPFSEGNGNSASEPFAGSFDLKHSYTMIDDNIYWTGALNGFKHQNGHLYYNISDKYIADEIYQNFNIEKCYGIDFENERIFLPRKNKRYLVKEYHKGDAWYELYSDGWLRQGNICYVGYAISNGWGASDIALLYSYNNTNYTVVMSGSPIYTGSYGTSDYVGERYTNRFTQHFYNAAQHPQYYVAEGYTDIPEDLFEYEYVCVGNTIQNNAISNITEIVTSENDTIPLFFSKYDSSILDDISFVRADNTWLSGNLYTTAYTRLENQLSSNNPQIKVIREEDMISGQDYSDYFQIRQSTNEFKLPIRTNNRVLVASKRPTTSDSTWYNWYSDGWLEQGGQFPIYANWIDRTINLSKPYLDTSYYVGVTTGHYAHTDAPSVSAKTTYSFHCQPYVDNDGGAWFTCGYGLVPSFNDYTENTHLYFKLYNAVQNLQLLNVSEILNIVNSKLNADLSNVQIPTIIEKYQNGTSWYRVWSDGWCEQGGSTRDNARTDGYNTQNGSRYVYTINLLKTYKDATYTILNNQYYANGNYGYTCLIGSPPSMKLNNTFQLGDYYGYGFDWVTYGYLAQGQY